MINVFFISRFIIYKHSGIYELQQGCTTFHKCSSHFKILGAIRVTWSKVHTEDPPVLDPTVQLVVAATRHQEFVNPSITILNPGKIDTTSKRYVPYILRIYRAQQCVTRVNTSTLGCRFAKVRFTAIHYYDPCRVGPSTLNLWCITVATQASFLYLVRF
jgi:hypothetical protein